MSELKHVKRSYKTKSGKIKTYEYTFPKDKYYKKKRQPKEINYRREIRRKIWGMEDKEKLKKLYEIIDDLI